MTTWRIEPIPLLQEVQLWGREGVEPGARPMFSDLGVGITSISDRISVVPECSPAVSLLGTSVGCTSMWCKSLLTYLCSSKLHETGRDGLQVQRAVLGDRCWAI